MKLYRLFVKRLLDIVLSALGIAVLAVPMLAVAAAVKLDTPGPALFRQKRIGREKRTFTIYKFRSMPVTAPRDTPTHQLDAKAVKLTRLGAFLRRTSIDELPQLFNILRGDMSVVGPRPALWNQDDLIALRDTYGVNDVRPGLTGWAQINGRDELPIEVKAAYDREYVEEMSFLFDVKCFLGTIGKVLKHEGVVEGGADAAKQEERVG